MTRRDQSDSASPWAKRMGATRPILFGGGDCWYPELHAASHQPHPVTGREVCLICHPPVAVRVSR